tara:strand:- start:337 stop:510 length:174 start_codon:yes stop_codon:yes gene_type:complete
MINVEEYLKKNLIIELKIKSSVFNLPKKERKRIAEAMMIIETGLNKVGKVVENGHTQ